MIEARPPSPQLHVQLKVEPPEGVDAQPAWERCGRAVGPVAQALAWTVAAPDAATAVLQPDGSLSWTLPIDAQDRRRTWQELCQSVGLALLWSRLLPSWVFRIEDPTGLLAASLGLNAPLVLVDGQATRPRRHGPPAPAANLQGPLRALLQEVLGAEAERLGLLPEPALPSGPEPSERPAVQAAAPGQARQPAAPKLELLRAALRPASAETLQPASLDLAIRASDPEGPQAQRAELLVVLRDAAGDPLGVELLELAAPPMGGVAEAAWLEALAQPPAEIAAVELQLGLLRVLRIDGRIVPGGAQSKPAELALTARLLPPDPAGGSLLLLVLAGEFRASHAAELSLSVDLLDADGQLLAELSFGAQIAQPGPLLLEWAKTLSLATPLAELIWRCDLVQSRRSARLTVPLGPGIAPRPWAAPGPTQARVASPAGLVPAPRPLSPAPPAAQPAPLLPRLPVVAPPPSADRIQRAIVEPWQDVQALFPLDSLDSAGRDRVRELLHSPDVHERIAGCRIATACGWRTTVHAMRRMLDDADPRLRAAAATGIGALAGPAMEHLLRQLIEKDADPTVVEAARAGMAAITSRSPR